MFNKEEKKDAPREEISYFYNNHGTSPHRSSDMVSHPNSKMKKYRDF